MNILLLKTFPLTLHDWKNIGILDREINLLKNISQNSNIKYFLFSFGDESEKQYRNLIKPIELISYYDKIKKPKKYLFLFLSSLLIPFRIKKILKKIDYLQTNQFWGVWIVLLINIIFKKKYILRFGFEFHHFAKKAKKNKIYLFLIKLLSMISYGRAYIIIVTSKEIKNYITSNFGINKNKITIIPNYIDTSLFKPIMTKNKFNKILCVGRLNEQKNYNLLIESLNSSKIEIDIIGHGDRNNLIELSRKNNVKVNFIDNIENNKLPLVYNSYSLFVLSSKYEGHPKSLLEAMSCGCRIIATDVDGIRENHNGKNFLLVKEDKYEIGSNIIEMINNPSLNKEMGEFARLYVLKNYDMQLVIKKFLNVYYKIEQ